MRFEPAVDERQSHLPARSEVVDAEGQGGERGADCYEHVIEV